MEQIVMSGLIFGCVYGLVALGQVLIFRTTGIVNFAHGEMAMVTTFVAFTLLTRFQLPYPAAFLLALAFSAAFGAVIYLAVVRFVDTAPHLNQLVLTLGLFLAIHGVAGLIWGHSPSSFPPALEGSSIPLGPVYVTPNEMFVLVTTCALAAVLFALFRFTRVGLAMRASSQDLTAARLMGIDVRIVFTVTWGAGSVLAGIAGILTAPFTFLNVTMMFNVLIMAFAAATLAGFYSLPGAVIGGLIIGIFGNLVSYYWAPEMALVCTFVLIVTVLYIRPQGIFASSNAVKKV
ncbi:branched-chain amino acid ABC transporter permease [Aminobacter aminovorans]|uniref:Branched-chain amino acid ABC transporter permease n=1 Tax=Aminobacter aminovorans TaxID=83263 RepID=A0AAC8YW16_AMIAI|nr:branched-chain amino acid ABC transporter permease [Aminobacter aminovorans]AMS45468.1 Branched-chain amino acid ABC transporter permease [Aminobacter aminovorans]MBB3708675.1 branched-chain amino acid transport system permease protein [Aminobacter aminovorans]